MHGFSLIESLIAIVIFAVALLGIAKLQLTNMQLQQISIHQQQADLLAQEIIENIYANNKGLQAYFNTGQQHANCLNTQGCSALEMAENDIFEWQNHVQTYLPQGAATICRDSTANDGTPSNFACDALITSNVPIAIKIWWFDKNSNAFKLQALSIAP